MNPFRMYASTSFNTSSMFPLFFFLFFLLLLFVLSRRANRIAPRNAFQFDDKNVFVVNLERSGTGSLSTMDVVVFSRDRSISKRHEARST